MRIQLELSVKVESSDYYWQCLRHRLHSNKLSFEMLGNRWTIQGPTASCEKLIAELRADGVPFDLIQPLASEDVSHTA